MASFDPQAFGETMREIAEVTSGAQMDSAIEHLNKSKDLTKVVLSDNVKNVKEQLPALLKRLNEATRERGTKTALAKFMGVKLPTISRWLSGEKEPGGETTLRLLHWVEQQERKQ
jgi:transcriptional regulator with XRE-family HTH domain